MTAEEYQTGLKKQSGHKYNARRMVVDGINFPSLAQAGFYRLLKMQKAAGLIENFLVEVPFRIPASPRAVVYWLDFLILAEGQFRAVDVKGKVTAVFKIKKKLVEYNFAPLRVEMWRQVGAQFEEVTC